MEDGITIELSVEDWSNVMGVLQGGVYRQVAPLIMKINNQLVAHNQRIMAQQQLTNGVAPNAYQPIEIPN